MRNILFFFLIASSFLSYGQSYRLSSEAEISVITCGPFQAELYSAFGHSAVRVYDPVNNLDDIYNYGVFDFNQPNFYLNFAKGYLYYKLGVYDYPSFRNAYIYYNRYIHEQVLSLTPAQKDKVYDYLVNNSLPENQNYVYDYFYNNCATKVRDVFVDVFGDSVTFDGSYVTTEYSIRDLTDIYLVHQPWGDLGIDICLGLPMDKVATPYEYMFLPDYIESGFDHATIKTSNGSIPIVKETRIVYESRPEDLPSGLPHPLWFFFTLLAISVAISFYDLKRKKASTWFDAILFGVVGAIGWLLLLLWTATDHHAAAKNFNLLWALPTHLIVVFAFIKQPVWLKSYFLVSTIILLITIITWAILPQNLNNFLIPVVATLLIRSVIQYWLRRPEPAP